MSDIRDKAAIVGIGETEFSWDSGRSELQLACEAIKAACDDSGISPQEIDGLVRYEMDSNNETMLVQALGINNLRHWEAIPFGGGAANATLGHAAAAIAAGYCNYVVCFRAANLRSGLRLGQARGPERIPGGFRGFHSPYGVLTPAHTFGLFARRYMHKYGGTSRDFGWVAVTLRFHASRNPRALRRQPITIEDHQNSRVIADPLRLLGFCQENDGAAALIMTTPERARDLRHADTITLVEAAAQGSGSRNDGVIYRPDLAVAESVHTAQDLWSRARLTHKDMDAFMFYDHFTPFCLLGLEAYGFVPFWRSQGLCPGWSKISGSTALYPPIPTAAITQKPTSTD